MYQVVVWDFFHQHVKIKPPLRIYMFFVFVFWGGVGGCWLMFVVFFLIKSCHTKTITMKSIFLYPTLHLQ